MNLRDLLRVLVSAVTIVAISVLAAAPAAAATFTVNTTNDVNDGVCNAAHCSLREAINAANAAPGADTIAFNIVGAPPLTIQPTSALPIITGVVTIDGTTQPGFAGTPVIELDGSLAGSVTAGLQLTAGGSTIKGLVINRFRFTGLLVTSAGGNTIQGNFIGTNSTGTLDFGNGGRGVDIRTSNNVVGGTSAGAGNLISGNNQAGMTFQAGSGSVVQGNLIGTDITGSFAIPNAFAANLILSSSASGNLVGGTAPGARNVISGGSSGVNGILLGGSGNTIQGNLIGTDQNGVIDLGNTANGIGISGANNLIGGSTPSARNIISGNNQAGIFLDGAGATGNVVQGNYIGTNASGTAAIGNNLAGIDLRAQANNNVIGGTASGEGNLISGNSNVGGIRFDATGGAPTGTTVQGNLIGTNAAGTSGIPNRYGVEMVGGANVVGGSAVGAGNVIAFNTFDGVLVRAGTGSRISGNSIHSNGSLGINLGTFFTGVTPNDPGDGDTGPNNLQNFPVLTSVTRSGSTAQINGTLNSQPQTAYTIEFFSNAACDPSLHGEGENFLGSTSVTTDGSGNVSFTFTASSVPPAHSFFTATATDPFSNTSEFSACQEAEAGPGPPATVTLDPPTDVNPVGTDHTVTATVKDAAGNPTPDIVVRFTVQGSVSASGSCTTDANGQCNFTYQGPPLPGADAISAFADTNGDGDQDAGEPPGAATKTWVLPVSTPGCEVTISNGGLITAANGDTATFGGHALVSSSGEEVSGQQEYQDHGPAQPMNVHSINVLAAVCSVDRTEATIFGEATIDGSGSFDYRIRVKDASEPGTSDQYGILLSNGYFSGDQTLEGGNVQITVHEE